MNGLLFTANDEIPSADCPYISPDTCIGEPGSQPEGCCKDSGAAKLGLQLSIMAMLAVALAMLYIGEIAH